MKSFVHKMLFLAIFLGISFHVFAQFPVQTQIAQRYFEAQIPNWGIEKSDIADLHLQSSFQDKKTGATYLYFIQRHNGIPIYNAILNVVISKENEIVNVGNRLVSNVATKANTVQALIQPTEAILSAARHFEVSNLAAKASPNLKEKKNATNFVYEKGSVSSSDIPVELNYQLLSNGDLKLAWNLSIDMIENSDYWSTRVDAVTGEVIDQNNFTVYCSFGEGPFLGREKCEHIHHHTKNEEHPIATAAGGSYNVFQLPLESPNHGSQSMVVGPEDSLASPFGWHDVDGVDGADYTITRGNNVHAYLDEIAGNQSQGNEPDGGADLIFDFPYDPSLEPDQMKDLAVTNLFYVNNMIHDITYQYGFTEETGNFQTNNYNNGGSGGDHVNAEAQDGSGENNANFSTPSDGGNGRMQMFLWNTSSNQLFLEGDSDITGWYSTGSAQYGPRIDATTNITADIVEAVDGFFAPSETDGCESIINSAEINGKIALVDRGGCDFELKTMNAQAAGAIAVILCNFNQDAPGLGGSPDIPAEPTIPTISLGNSDCALIRQYIAEGQTFTATIARRPNSGPEEVDGDFDNGIIAHEYGHGISNRLTGGRLQAGCLSNAEQMGEGWSDFFTLITTAKESDRTTPRGVGTFAEKDDIDGRGLRPFPYSTDLSINPLTYQDASQLSIPHGLGSVWCTMLWDLYWAMADEHGFDADVKYGTGGNNMAIALVMEGMRQQACRPGFVDGRDGILAADRLLFNGDNQCLIWNVFARRGLGFNADQGNSDVVGDNIEGFESLPACVKELQIAKTSNPLVNAGDDITVELEIANFKDDPLTNIVVTDELPDGLTFSGIESITGIDASLVNVNSSNIGMVVFEFDANENLSSGQVVTITYNAKTDPEKFSIQMYLDDVPDNSNDTRDKWLQGIQSDPDVSPNIWRISNRESTGDGWSWNVDDARTETRQLNLLADPISVSGKQPVLRFYHKYDTYAGQHGGVIEFSEDGTQFFNKSDNFFRNGYSGFLAYQSFVEPYLYGFSGQSGPDFKASYLDLNEFNGKDIFVRFRFGTRATDDPNWSEMSFNDYFNGTSGDGWFVDDFELMDMFNYDGEACVTTAEGDNLCAKAPGRGTIIESQLPPSSVQTLEDGSQLSVYPNPASNVLHLSFDSNTNREINVKILTLDGKIMQSQTMNIFEGKQVFTLNVDNFSAGFYIVNIQSEEGIITEKIVIE